MHRCGPEQSNNFQWNYGNCTYGPKQPFYWYQQERNNMQEGTYTPPLYQDLYNFHDGAQNDIFENTTDTAIPAAQATQNSSSLPSKGTPTPLSSKSLPAVQIPSHASAPDGASSTSGRLCLNILNPQVPRPRLHRGLAPKRGRSIQPPEATATLVMRRMPNKPYAAPGALTTAVPLANTIPKRMHIRKNLSC